MAVGEVEMEVKGGYAVVGGVWVNGTGPYRMLVDTGAESVSLRPGLAEGAGLRARYAVEVESVSGVTVVPVAAAERMAVGGSCEGRSGGWWWIRGRRM
ncbi:MAG: retropepsin-like domain-containing protein [Bryobacterales bacterium]|nr:retropepsin-like domain-containing protein [Bryobacterales bacterium]